MARKKKLNINHLLKNDKAYEKETPVVINDSVTLYYAEKFGQDKIDDLLKELHETILYAEENKYDFPTSYEHVVQYLEFLIFKHFTNLQEALIDADYYTNIEAYRNAYKKGWMIKVIDEFDHNEMGKVYEKFTNLIENGARLEKYVEDARNQLLNTIQNDELKAKFAKDVIDGKKGESIQES